jgi:hypothetical protein
LGISGRQFANTLSYDDFFKGIRSGVGITAGESAGKYSFGTSNNSFAKIVVSPKYSLKGKYTIASFVGFTVSEANFVSQQMPSHHLAQSFSVGFLANSTKAYVGISTNVVVQPKRSGSPYFVAQAGYTFQRTPDAKFSFTPQIVLAYSHEFPSLSLRALLPDYSFMFRHEKFIWGITRAGLSVGYQKLNFKIQITQDVNGISDVFESKVSSLQSYQGNIAVRYVFKKKSSLASFN